jgi:hypothetical protein
MRVLAGSSQPRVTPPPDRFTLVNGVPQTIALQYSNGKRVASRIPGAPDQIMYTLADGRRAYFPLEVGAEIDALRLDRVRRHRSRFGRRRRSCRHLLRIRTRRPRGITDRAKTPPL